MRVKVADGLGRLTLGGVFDSTESEVCGCSLAGRGGVMSR
jgi:hypothetical protein